MVAGTACGYGLRLWLRLQRVAAVGAAMVCGYGVRLQRVAAVVAAVVAVLGCGYGLRLWSAAMGCGSAAGCEIGNEF